MDAISGIFEALGGWFAPAFGGLWAAIIAWPIRETLLIALFALLIERVLGWPSFLQKRTGHPVQWIGGMIARLEGRLNAQDGAPLALRAKGMGAMIFLIVFWGALAWLAARLTEAALPRHAWLAQALLAAPWLAQCSLRQHVRAVGKALEEHPGSLDPARRAVGRIVGRDPAHLDESGVVKGAIESLAENASDGVIAPAFWLALFGLPGVVIYKVVNTADSMIGHKSERFIHFGWFAARLDDLMNWIPARLTALLFALAAALTSPSAGARALHAMWRDARRHVSPNAGWPEAAMAGALDVALGGPRAYGGRVVELAWMGDGRERLTREDIRKALSLYGQMLTLTLLLAGVFWLFMPD